MAAAREGVLTGRVVLTLDTALAIDCKKLRKVYSDFWLRPRVVAVDGVDLAVRSGEVFGLLGPNGSGKSTTIKMLLGLLFPTSGEVRVLGRPPGDSEAQLRLGYLPEESSFYPYLTGRETIDFYGRLFGLSDAIRKERVEELLAMVGLEGAADRPLREYSKGMQRRIGLAQALINDPALLILDEPTSGLDPIGTRQFKDFIGELRDQGKSVLVSSHLLSDMEEICDQVAILYGGKIQEVGTVSRILVRDDRLEWLTSGATATVLEAARAAVTEAGIEIDEVTPARRRLEDRFLEIVEEARESSPEISGASGGSGLASFLTGEGGPGEPRQGTPEGETPSGDVEASS